MLFCNTAQQHFTHLAYVRIRREKRTGGAKCSCVYASIRVWYSNTLSFDNSTSYCIVYYVLAVLLVHHSVTMSLLEQVHPAC